MIDGAQVAATEFVDSAERRRIKRHDRCTGDVAAVGDVTA